MIRGYFRSDSPESRPSPYVSALVNLPSIGIFGMEVQFLVDSGANDTILGYSESQRIFNDGADLSGLPRGTIPGVGGFVPIRVVQAELEFGNIVAHLPLPILEPMRGQPSGVPSLLGRDVLSHFALFMEERTERVMLLEPDEVDGLEVG